MPLLTIQAANDHVPVGVYHCRFTSFEPLETEKGKAYRWAFTNDADGRTISVLSDAEKPPTPNNKTGRFLSALSRQPLQAGVVVNPDDYVGKPYIVIVGARPDGVGTKVETFSAK